MLTNTLIISLGTAVLSILLVFILRRNILKQPEGGKRIIDSVKIVSLEVKKGVNKQNMVLFPMAAAVFVLILYLLNWQTALAFLAGALATILINQILPHIVAQNSGRVVEASRKSFTEGANIALKSGVVSASLVLGVSLLITAGFYAIFQNTQVLVGLGFGVALMALYIKLSSVSFKNPQIDPNLSINLFGLFTLATIMVMVIAKATFGKPTNPMLVSFTISSALVVSFLVASFFMRFFKTTKKFQNMLYLSLPVQIVLFAGSIYFAKIWLLKGIGIHSLLNFYGLSLIALIVLFLAGMSVLLNVYHQVINSALYIADKNEIAEDAKKQLLELSSLDKLFQFINKFYIIKSSALVSMLFFAAYFRTIQSSFSLDLGNYLVLIGLFIGLILIAVYNFQKNKYKSENIAQNIIIIVSVLFLPIIIGLTLGPVALGGYLMGVILTGLFGSAFLSKTFGNIILLSSIIALLIASSIV